MCVCVCVCVQTIFDRKALWLIHQKKNKKSPIRTGPPANAGHAGSVPGWGMKTPHAEVQLSLPVTTREKPAYCSEDPACHN